MNGVFSWTETNGTGLRRIHGLRCASELGNLISCPIEGGFFGPDEVENDDPAINSLISVLAKINLAFVKSVMRTISIQSFSLLSEEYIITEVPT